MPINDILSQFHEAATHSGLPEARVEELVTREMAQTYLADPMHLHYTPYVWMLYRIRSEPRV